MYRFPISQPDITAAELDAVTRVLAAGELTQSGGPTVAGFESDLARYLDTDSALVVACSSGTTALHLALLSLGIGPHDRVLVPSLTYVATVAALRYVGAEPVFVDVDGSWTLDVDKLQAAAHGCAAVIPVGLYGMPAEMESIRAIARQHGLRVIEDACQSFGASVGGRKSGLLVDAGVFSFYANKLITTGGEGGAVVLEDRERATEARRYRGQGQSLNRRYWHEVVGYNYRMTAMQAAFGRAQLARIEDLTHYRSVAAAAYFEGLGAFEVQTSTTDAAPVDWLFTLLVPAGVDRDSVAAYLSNLYSIETRPAFPAVHTMPPYRVYADGRLPKTEDIAARGLSLPTHPRLSLGDAQFIAHAFKEAVAHPATQSQSQNPSTRLITEGA